MTSSDCDEVIGASYRDKEEKINTVFIKKEGNFLNENNRGLSPLQHLYYLMMVFSSLIYIEDK